MNVAGASRQDRTGAELRDAAEEWRVEALHLDDDGVGVRRLDRVDIVEHFEVDRAGLRVSAAIEGVFNVARVHQLAVVELHALPEDERVGQQVQAGGELLRQPWHDLEARRGLNEAAMDVLQHARARGCTSLLDIEALRSLGMAPN